MIREMQFDLISQGRDDTLARTKMTEIQVDRVQLIAAVAMHMHARVRPWNNVLSGYRPAPVMYLCNDIYVHTSSTRLAIRTGRSVISRRYKHAGIHAGRF